VSVTSGDDVVVGGGWGLHGLFEEAVEQQASRSGGTAVEPEGVLVEVGVEVLAADRALVGAEQPPLQQRGDAVYARHDHVRRVAGGADAGRFVVVAVLGDRPVAGPSVGLHRGAGRDRLAHERHQARPGDVGDLREPDPAVAAGFVQLQGDGHDGLGVGLTARYTLLLATDVGLVDLDQTRQQVTVRAHHRSAQLVLDRPRGLVAAQPEDPLEPERAGTELLVGDVPGGREPGRQRSARLVEDGARRHRGLVAARSAGQPPAALQPGLIDHPAPHAREPLRPSQIAQVSQARVVIREPRVELGPASRVVPTCHRSCLDRHHKMLTQEELIG